MARLDGKVAMITGASRGIGRSVALAYAVEGADIAIVGAKEDFLQLAAKDRDLASLRDVRLVEVATLPDDVVLDALQVRMPRRHHSGTRAPRCLDGQVVGVLR